MFSVITFHLKTIAEWKKSQIISSSDPFYLIENDLIGFRVNYFEWDLYDKEVTEKLGNVNIDFWTNMTITTFLDAFGVGEKFHFYLDGNLHSKSYCNKNGINGKFISYFRGGGLWEESFYVDGMRHGKYLEYRENGTLIHEENYFQNELNGQNIIYYPNGQPSDVKFFIKGNLHGEAIEYYNNGVIKSKSKYINGSPDGKRFEYDKEGELITITDHP